MIRTAILLAAVAALAGCDTCDTPGTATFYWRFQNSLGELAGDYGVTDAGCAAAGVDQIRIDIGGVAEVVDCVFDGVPGAVLPGFTSGTYSFAVDGLRNGEIVFIQDGTVTIRDCGDTRVDLTLQAVANQTLVVFYDFNGAIPTSCNVANQPVAITYQLEDAQANVVDTTVRFAGTPPAPVEFPVSCDAQFFGLTLPSLTSGLDALPLGNYRFPHFRAVNATTGAPVLQVCNATIAHTGFPVVLDLRPPTAACP